METVFAEGQTSLAQASEDQYKSIRDEVQIHGRNQERALVAQHTTTTQVRTEIESISSRIGALASSAKSENE